MAVGQAVRREVAAMSEGIERTLARASELETLVNGEVHELERSYSDNEIRIRSLVEDLGNERAAIVSMPSGFARQSAALMNNCAKNCRARQTSFVRT